MTFGNQPTDICQGVVKWFDLIENKYSEKIIESNIIRVFENLKRLVGFVDQL